MLEAYDWKFCWQCNGCGDPCYVCRSKGVLYYDEKDNEVRAEDFVDREEPNYDFGRDSKIENPKVVAPVTASRPPSRGIRFSKVYRKRSG